MTEDVHCSRIDCGEFKELYHCDGCEELFCNDHLLWSYTVEDGCHVDNFQCRECDGKKA